MNPDKAGRYESCLEGHQNFRKVSWQWTSGENRQKMSLFSLSKNLYATDRVSLSVTFCLSVFWSSCDHGTWIAHSQSTSQHVPCPGSDEVQCRDGCYLVCAILALFGDRATLTIFDLLWLSALFSCALVPCRNMWHVDGLYSGPAESATRNHRFAFGLHLDHMVCSSCQGVWRRQVCSDFGAVWKFRNHRWGALSQCTQPAPSHYQNIL